MALDGSLRLKKALTAWTVGQFYGVTQESYIHLQLTMYIAVPLCVNLSSCIDN